MYQILYTNRQIEKNGYNYHKKHKGVTDARMLLHLCVLLQLYT